MSRKMVIQRPLMPSRVWDRTERIEKPEKEEEKSGEGDQSLLEPQDA